MGGDGCLPFAARRTSYAIARRGSA